MVEIYQYDCVPDLRADFSIHGSEANRYERRNTFELNSDSVASGVGVQVAVDGGSWESPYAFIGRANAAVQFTLLYN